MSTNEILKKKNISLDWLVRGVLTKIGDIFDGLTGREWKPSSSLATSELIERLKRLLDSEARIEGDRGKYVPHNLKLKMQWDKFSTDSEKALKTLENELLVATVDHINDNRYQTHAPLKLQIKPDYFTEGVKLLASFDEFSEDEKEAEINVTVPEIKVGDYVPEPQMEAEPEKPKKTVYFAEYTAAGKTHKTKLKFENNKRLSVGRTRENDLALNDDSVSKIHASLVVNSEGVLQVADTGSTNGTFINGQRIAYGRAFLVNDGDTVRFGTVEVSFKRDLSAQENAGDTMDELPKTQNISQEFGEYRENNYQQTQNISRSAADSNQKDTAKIEVPKTESLASTDFEKKS